ncbi:hypothetical protein NJT12_04880 [Flavobacterium sp. AC]|uniref:Pentapeptide repeat-containing protein n=1 Tax=Flavobacterium azizsancarii TaxID=2961580 RepID=A0ABT4W8Y6_9FLAO|nr:hypothetical protein [Flavobacterium azizsancarii]MDA6068951.1 hypothetical protein [Flavobacterium azizsancarii]
MTKKEIKAFCKANAITSYYINDDLSIDVDGSVCLTIEDTELPVQFNEVNGDFRLTGSDNFTSLKGSPRSVFGNLHCADLSLTSLDGAPDYVQYNFECSGNPITCLEGMPEVLGGFVCFDTLVTIDSIFELSPKSEERVLTFINGYFDFNEYIDSRNDFDVNAKTWLEFNDLLPAGSMFNYAIAKRQHTIAQIIN